MENHIFRKNGYKYLTAICLILAFSSTFVTQAESAETFNSSGAVPIENQFSISHSPVQYDFAVPDLALMNPQILRGNLEWVECVKDRVYGSRIYDYSQYEKILDNLDSIGVEYLGCFVYGWGWWPQDTFYELPQEEWPDYFHFVENFTDHFQRRIQYYEIWNEPDIGFWRQTDEEFYQFSRDITDIIHATDPDAKILSPGVTGPNIEYLDAYVTALTDEGFSEMFDIFAFHAYSGINAEYLSERLWEAKDFLKRHNFEVELWITEIGLSTAVKNEELVETYQEDLILHQATQVLKIYSLCIEQNISAVFWYCHLDWCDTGELNGEGRFGLMECLNQTTHEYRSKPAGNAYQLFNTLATGGTYYPLGIEKKGTSVNNLWAYYFLTTQNTITCVFWSRGINTKLEFSISSPDAGVGSEKIPFAVKSYDYMANSSSIWVGGSSSFKMDAGFTPTLLEFDYNEWLLANSIAFQPLTLHIEIRYEFNVLFYLILIPITLGVAVFMTIMSHKEKQQEAKTDE